MSPQRHLQVAIGDQIIGEVSLATQALVATHRRTFDCGFRRSNRPTAILVPSEGPSTAKLSLSNIQFLTFGSDMRRRPVSLGLAGNVFRDLDNDGQRDEGEPGLAGRWFRR